VIVDGNRGVLILNPDEETRKHYEQTRRKFRTFEKKLGALRDLPAQTSDDLRVLLMGNIEFPHEAKHCLQRGADGVGLYRTEFLYLTGPPVPPGRDPAGPSLPCCRRPGPGRVSSRPSNRGADSSPGAAVNSTKNGIHFSGCAVSGYVCAI